MNTLSKQDTFNSIRMQLIHTPVNERSIKDTAKALILVGAQPDSSSKTAAQAYLKQNLMAAIALDEQGDGAVGRIPYTGTSDAFAKIREEMVDNPAVSPAIIASAKAVATDVCCSIPVGARKVGGTLSYVVHQADKVLGTTTARQLGKGEADFIGDKDMAVLRVLIGAHIPEFV